MELSIDTSTRYASVGLSREGEIAVELSWRSEQNHSVELVPTIRDVMERAKVEVGQLEAIFVTKGPGGFSALRVGMSTAKALAMANELPLVGIGTLDIEAHPYLGLGLPVCALIEAGRNNLYVGRFAQSGGPQEVAGQDYSVVTFDELVSSIERTTLFCGEAARPLEGRLRERLGPQGLVAGAAPPTRRATVLARLGHRRLSEGEPDDLETLQPIYMRGSQFDVAQRRRATTR